MFRREFLTALALLPFVGRLLRVREHTESAQKAIDYQVILESLTNRFEAHLKKRISFVRGGKGHGKKFHVGCLISENDLRIDDDFLIPMAIAWSQALSFPKQYRFHSHTRKPNDGTLNYVTENGICGVLGYSGKEQKYTVDFSASVTSE